MPSRTAGIEARCKDRKFLREVMDEMDRLDYVDRYSYFFVDGEMTNGHSASPIGKLFAFNS